MRADAFAWWTGYNGKSMCARWMKGAFDTLVSPMRAVGLAELDLAAGAFELRCSDSCTEGATMGGQAYSCTMYRSVCKIKKLHP